MSKQVLITGGNAGIGFATAQLFKQQGYAVTITGRDEQRLNDAANELGVDAILCDMSDIAGQQQIIEKFAETGLDALVLNAALATFMPIDISESSHFDQYTAANLEGPYFLIKNLLPALKKKQGAVTVITSAVVDNGLPNASLYAMTKGGMDALVRSLAVEFAPQHVRINAVAPGAVDTPILSKLGIPPEQLAEIRQQQEAMIPLGRYGQPAEIAQVVHAQIKCSYVTGATWAVDGGVNAI